MKTFNKLLALIILLFAATISSARAQERPGIVEGISSFQNDILINSDGTVDFTETIHYYFPTSRHGIIREIPLGLTNQDGDKFLLTIDVTGVNVDGKRGQYSDEYEGGIFSLKIGDPDVTITGTHVYEIKYKMSGALTYFTDHDELYWDVTGTEWPVPILEAQTNITLDPSLTPEFLEGICYTGSYGSAEQACTVTKTSPNTISINSDRMLEPYEGLTAAVKFPTGLVTVLEPKKDNSDLIVGLLLILYFIVLPGYLIVRALKIRKKLPEERKVVSAWFDPPKLPSGRFLTAGEVGTLIDKRVDIRDISGELIQLAQKGYIKIREEEKKSGLIIKKPVFTFVKEKEWENDPKLMQHEKNLLDIIFLGSDEVSTEKIGKRIGFSSKLSTVMSNIADQLVTDKVFLSNVVTNQDTWTAIMVFSAFFFNPLLIFAALLSRHAVKRTSEGGDAIAKAQSLKNFMVTQDEQYKFQAENKMMFEKLLPFAVSFGVEKIWIERFKDLVMSPPDWYEGSTIRAFSYALLSDSFNNSMKSATQMSTQRSSSGFSSGFSSGGGFSGGGGGGGGGGSW